MYRYKNKQGFTIIEVVLVLAIAGLIFVMVFIALPALQRSQRDAQRKRQAEVLHDALNRKKANSRNSFPYGATVREMIEQGYIGESEMLDPLTGQVYKYMSMSHESLNDKNQFTPGHYAFFRSRRCEDIGEEESYTPNDTTSVVFALEGGGYYCFDVDFYVNILSNPEAYDDQMREIRKNEIERNIRECGQEECHYYAN